MGKLVIVRSTYSAGWQPSKVLSQYRGSGSEERDDEGGELHVETRDRVDWLGSE